MKRETKERKKKSPNGKRHYYGGRKIVKRDELVSVGVADGNMPRSKV
jgi:hypothetical protein